MTTNNIEINNETLSAKDKIQKLRYALKRAVKAQPADALLLSGGIDSGLLAALDPKTPAITVTLEGQGIDASHAQKVAENLGTPWYLVNISKEQALADIPELIQLTGSYDIGMKSMDARGAAAQFRQEDINEETDDSK